MPAFSYKLVQELISPAFTIAILAGIESLLSAVVSDGMIGDTHKSNAELIGQGLGNIFSGLFGGIPATGAIARTAANVRNGGRTPIAGITHCITLSIILVVLMPLASLIPMTTLAAVLLVVAWNMADWTSFFHLCKTAPKSDMIVLVATFFLTVFFDLVVAIEVGVVLAALLFMKRMAETADVTAWKYADEPDVTPGEAEKMRDIHTQSVYLRSVDRCFSPQPMKFLQLPVTSQPKSSLSVCEVFRQSMRVQCVPCVTLLPVRRKNISL